MYRGFLASFVVIILVALLAASLFTSLPFGLWRIHVLPLLMIFIYLLFNIRAAAWWALIGGLVFEVYSFHVFGFYLIMLWLALFIIHMLFTRIMTNRSLYSVMTAAIAVTIMCDIYTLVADYASGLPHLSFGLLAEKFFFSLVVNLAITIIVFYIVHVASRRLRPVFLTFNR